MNQTLQFHETRNPMLLSYSGISTYLTCRHRWRLQNVLGVRSPVQARPLEVGQAVHSGMEAALSFQGTAEDGIRAWADSLVSKLPEDMDVRETEDLIEGYASDATIIVDRITNEIIRRGLMTVIDRDGVPIVEREVIIPFPGWDGFAGHLDWVCMDQQGRIWVADFKTRKTFYGDDSEQVNLQNATYQYLGRSLGLDIVGTLTFQVRSTSPAKPKRNKDGTMSRALIATDWMTYLGALNEAGLNPVDYLDMRDKLQASEWTRVLEAYRSEDEIDRIWEWIIKPVGAEMAWSRDLLMADTKAVRVNGMSSTPRNLSQRTCSGCNVRDVCLAGLKGYDVKDALRGFQYRQDAVSLAIDDNTL